jgi:hypothetical protein
MPNAFSKLLIRLTLPASSSPSLSKTLEAASVGQNVRPFSEFLGGLARERQKAAGKKVRMRAKEP